MWRGTRIWKLGLWWKDHFIVGFWLLVFNYFVFGFEGDCSTWTWLYQGSWSNYFLWKNTCSAVSLACNSCRQSPVYAVCFSRIVVAQGCPSWKKNFRRIKASRLCSYRVTRPDRQHRTRRKPELLLNSQPRRLVERLGATGGATPALDSEGKKVHTKLPWQNWVSPAASLRYPLLVLPLDNIFWGLQFVCLLSSEKYTRYTVVSSWSL